MRLKKKFVNFMIIPEDSAKSYSFRLSLLHLTVVSAVLVFLLFGSLAILLFYSRFFYTFTQAEVLKKENRVLKEHNAKIVELEKQIKQNEEIVKKISELAGLSYPFDPNETVKLFMIEDEKKTPVKELQELDFGPEKTSPKKVGLHYSAAQKDQIPSGMPLEGWISQKFLEENFGQKHSGIDIAAPEGTEVKATADGVVSYSGWDNDYGNLVSITHSSGYVSFYGHNSQILVKAEQKVKKGEVIALSGNTGKSTAPHLHYEIKKDSVSLDPQLFINLTLADTLKK